MYHSTANPSSVLSSSSLLEILQIDTISNSASRIKIIRPNGLLCVGDLIFPTSSLMFEWWPDFFSTNGSSQCCGSGPPNFSFQVSLHLQRIKEKMQSFSSWIRCYFLGKNLLARLQSTQPEGNEFPVSFLKRSHHSNTGDVHLLTKTSVSLEEFSRSEWHFSKTGLQYFSNEASLSFALGYCLRIIRNKRGTQVRLGRN